jgi:amino acid permease
MPRLTIAVALLALAVLASTMSYTGFLVVGVLADYLGTGRVMAGLVLGVFFARIPWVSQGTLRTVGLIPKPLRRPFMVSLLALCLSSFLSRGDYVPALFIGFATAFLLAFPSMRRAISGRMVSSFFKSADGQSRPSSTAGTVIDGEFRERKD